MKFTIIGPNGFIGKSLIEYLTNKGIECHTLELRKDKITNESLGHVIYAIGVPNFKERPFDAVDAHACTLMQFLKEATFDSFLYLSATHVYLGSTSTSEDNPITIDPSDFNELYIISKLMGEAICFASNKPNVRIVRPSNVTGKNFFSNLFIPSIIRDAVDRKKIVLHSTLDSEKDYIRIDDIVRILPEISLNGKHKIYNIARGQNTKTEDIVEEISRVTGCQVEVIPGSREYSFPVISIDRVKSEFEFNPRSVIGDLEEIIESYKKINSKVRQ
jgi:nucleoside-diphosphate-sugar epimerase